MRDMATVALFGGAFDPPHVGHTLVISALLKSGLCEQVWCVPSADRPDKSQHATAAQRLEMLGLALADSFASDTRLRVEDAQVSGRLPTSFTIDLLDYLKKAYPQHKFVWVIGADNLSQLDTWRDSARLLRETQFIAYPRPGFENLPASCHATVQLIDAKTSELSSAASSAIRERIRRNQDVAEFLSPSVARFIEKHRLYCDRPAAF